MDGGAELEAIEGLSPRHIADLQRMFQDEWWTVGRTLEETERVVAGSSLNLGFVEPSSQALVAYARVISDHVIKALVLDVIVRPDHRGRKLGAALMDRIVAHPSLASVKHFELYCLGEMEPFYQRWGFQAENDALRFMRRSTR